MAKLYDPTNRAAMAAVNQLLKRDTTAGRAKVLGAIIDDLMPRLKRLLDSEQFVKDYEDTLKTVPGAKTSKKDRDRAKTALHDALIDLAQAI